MNKMQIHIFGWLVVAFFLFVSFSMFLPSGLAIGRTLTGIVFMTSIFYVSGWLLANAFLIRRHKPLLFIATTVVVIILFSFVRVKILIWFNGNVIALMDQASDSALINLQNERLRNRFTLNSSLGIGRGPFLIGFLMNSIISVIAVLLRMYEHKAKKEKESREKLQHNQEAQIQYLKSQVNPHFLFNTLNNLYGLTYAKSELAPQMVLGLSDTMRYMIYETEQRLVPIEKELNFIRNYLDLEKMRISYPENIRVSIQVKRQFAYIPPLILIPFIENCFKHGTIGKEENGWIELDIWDEPDSFIFVCKNSFFPEESKFPNSSGIGLANVKKRLNLIFGDKYKLKTVKQQDEYMVSLQFPVFTNKDQL